MKQLLMLFVLLLVLPIPAHAGWRDLPSGPKILSVDPVVKKQTTVYFSKPQFAGKRVKVYVLLRYEVDRSSQHPYGLMWVNREATVVLDSNGKGSIQLTKIREDKCYFSLSLKQLEPHIERTQATKFKKLRR